MSDSIASTDRPESGCAESRSCKLDTTPSSPKPPSHLVSAAEQDIPQALLDLAEESASEKSHKRSGHWIVQAARILEHLDSETAKPLPANLEKIRKEILENGGATLGQSVLVICVRHPALFPSLQRERQYSAVTQDLLERLARRNGHCAAVYEWAIHNMVQR